MTQPKRGDFTRPHASDAALDAELEKALQSRDATPAPDQSLKQLWDDELEAELAAAMEGFDGESFDVPAASRESAADRTQVPGSERGQESSSGPRQAKVIRIRGEDVFLDLGAKSEGVIPLSQFGDNPPEPGAMIEVHLDRYDRDEGLQIMRLKGAAVHATWENLGKGIIVEARVVKEIKGGLEVEVDGIRGFLPISQIEIGRVEDVKPYLNERFRAIVTEANQREKNLVISRRDLLEQERAEMREKTWAELEEGQVRKGVVRSIRDFGAFVDLGGVDGLVHVSDLSWNRTTKPEDLVRLGDVVEVKVLKIDRENRKVGLGLKQLAASPWDDIEDRYEPGQMVKGKVTRVADFGAFVELEPGIEGLIHVSELASKRVFRVRDHAKEDQEVEVRVLSVDPDARRISLSLKPSPLATQAVAPPSEEDDDAEPTTPRPTRTTPLKGGLGDRDPNPFSRPPR